MKKTILSAAIAFGLSMSSHAAPFVKGDFSFELVGHYFNPAAAFDEGAAEIVSYDAKNQRLFVVNALETSVDVLDINDPSVPTLIGIIDASTIGGSANSVDVYHGLVAIAIEAEVKQENGSVAFYNASDLSFINSVEVGALPDMVKFSPNGKFVLVANEGEPDDDYLVDPDGSVSVIDLRNGVAFATVSNAGFTQYNGYEDDLRAKGVRIFGPGASASQDLEPEYITFSNDSKTAWVSLQEANALAKIDVKSATVTDILPLGTKDHSLPGNELDASNRDDGINIQNWPVQGMYMPDAIASYMFKGKNYIVTANEGDSRDYDGYSEEERVKDLILDPTAFPNASELQEDENLGRLKTTTATGDTDNDGYFDVIYSYGARSFSIWTEDGIQVFDSGAHIETRLKALDEKFEEADIFNSNNDENDSFDSRSDDKGPEPEGVIIGKIGSRNIAFIGLERVGGVMAYDVTNPGHVFYLGYINNRDFTVDAQQADDSVNPEVGDLGPEGIAFIRASDSPTGKPMIVVGNEVSGTTTLYQVNVQNRGSEKKSRNNFKW